MRIDQPLDPSQGHVAVQSRIPLPPPPVTVRRVLGIAQTAVGEETPKVAASPPDNSVTLDLSPEGREAARQAALEGLRKKASGQEDTPEKADDTPDAEEQAKAREVEELAERDREVRAHEQTLRAMAGTRVVRGATYAYEVGPDGRLYVVAGEVSFDTTEVPGDPEATLRKAEHLQKAALASADPSPQDRAAAAVAAAMAARARRKLHNKEGPLA